MVGLMRRVMMRRGGGDNPGTNPGKPKVFSLFWVQSTMKYFDIKIFIVCHASQCFDYPVPAVSRRPFQDIKNFCFLKNIFQEVKRSGGCYGTGKEPPYIAGFWGRLLPVEDLILQIFYDR